MNDQACNQAVFLDRDGVLIEDTNYVGKIERVQLIPDAAVALRRLREAGFRLFVVTNQSGVARGYFTRAAVEDIHRHLDHKLRQSGVAIDHYYVCPHHPDNNCDCRKPKPKFLREAARDYGLDLAHSYMVGDRTTDVTAGKLAGTKTVLVLTGAGSETLAQGDAKPDHVAANLTACADWILSQ